jgi:site-specific DNA-methyltransferase (adenine-specific)
MEINSIVTNEDCMKLMARYPDKYFDLAVVDPPYGIKVNISIGRRKGGKKSNYHKFAGEDNCIPNENFYDELFRVSKNQIIWGGNYMTEYLKPSSCWLFWDKGFSEEVTFAQFEMAWTSFNSTCKKFDFNAAKNKDRIHPTQKPISLYDWIFKNYAKEGDKILDTHLGSGSSRIAAYKAKLHFTACELDTEYFEAQEKRFSQFIAQQRLF